MSRYDRICQDILTLGMDFRINDLNEALQVKLPDQEWQEITDTIQAVIEVAISEIGYGVKGKKKPPRREFWNVATKLGHVQRFNPIKDYFAGLPDYRPYVQPGDAFPQPVYIPKLARYFKNPDGYFGTWLFRWMCGAIAKIFDQERNPMLVLIAPQRIGKSYFARWICSIGVEYFLEGSINPDSKDARLRLTDRFIQEVAELGATTRRSDVEALKEFITKRWVNDRMPYGKRPISKPALTSFIGSVNYDGAGFLNDPTGSSRFLAAEIEAIDRQYSRMFDPHLLWAEAFWFYNNSPLKPWVLSPDEQEMQAMINSQFEMVNAIDDVVDEFLEITGDPGDFMATIEIRNHLSPHYRFTNETTFARDLARALHARGCTPSRQRFDGQQGHRRGYLGVKRREKETIKL